MIKRLKSIFRQLRNRNLTVRLREQMVNSEPVFIISTGRTGTKFFENFLNNLSVSIICRHEPTPDFFELGMRKIRQGIRDCHEEILEGRAKYFSEAVAANKRYVESNPFLSYLVEDLLIAFPKSKIIWITRNPATYVVSAFSKSPDNSNAMYFYAEDDHRERVSAIDVNDPLWSSAWCNMDRFEKICWYWNHCNQTIQRQLQNIAPDRQLHVRYEEIFAPDRLRHLRSIAAFLDVDPDLVCMEKTTEKLNTNPVQMLCPAANWSAVQKTSFNQLTKTMRDQLGYDSVK